LHLKKSAEKGKTTKYLVVTLFEGKVFDIDSFAIMVSD